VLLLSCAAAARGHGDVHDTIRQISAEIEAQPGNTALRMERAGLYVQYEHFTEALADLDHITVAEPQNEMTAVLRALVFRRTGRAAEARGLQEAFLRKHPRHVQVRFDLCRTLADLKETNAALRELDTLIADAENPPPDAVAMRVQMTEARDAAEALAWLDGFLKEHPLPVFQEAALRLELKLGRSAAAVRRLDTMIAKAPRPESLCLRKAELLAASGDKAGAQAAARAAMDAIARLPEHLRQSPATAAMTVQARRFSSPTP
jgi:predicted Zn-dependent protease